MAYLRAEHIIKSFRKKPILHGVSFRVRQGEVVAFLGPNGAGKTTLLRIVMGLLGFEKTKSGQAGIYLDNTCVSSWAVSARVAAGLIYLPQHPSLFLDLTVLENLQIVFEHHNYWQKTTQTHRSRKDEFDRQMRGYLMQACLTDILQKKAYELSGGQKRKVEVVRSLLMQPKAIMLDEPFAGVDPKSIYELKELFKGLAKSGIAVLISDHHVDQLCSIADYIYVLIDGIVVTQGTLEQIMEHKGTKELYLGGEFHEEIRKKFVKH